MLWEHHEIAEGEVFCQKTALNFVDSLWEIFSPLTRGLSVAIASDEVVRDLRAFVTFLGQQEVTRLVLVPSYLQAILNEVTDLCARLPKVKYWISSGEALTPRLARQFLAQMPTARLVNIYGATECWDISWASIETGSQKISIGHPLPEVTMHVLTESFDQAPIGEPGEICVAGWGLARGYLHRPRLTAERFIPSSLGTGGGMYRTGDRGVYAEDGSVQFLGRHDRQVKVRGNRIELDEVEAALCDIEGVAEAAVVANEGRQGGLSLIGYLVPSAGQHLDNGVLRAALGSRLPEFMVPGAFVLLDAFPTLPNGKCDRGALPIPTREDWYVKPATDTEHAVAEAWRDILGCQRVGRHDNFYDIGGDSLRSLSAVARLGEQFDILLELGDLLSKPRLDEFAALIDQRRAAPRSRKLAPIRRRPAGT